MRYEQLKVGEKYITDHNTPIIITALIENKNGSKEVWAEWPSKKRYQVKSFEKSIVMHYSVHVGDQIALERDGKFFTVERVDLDGTIKFENGIFNYRQGQITVCKIKKRKLIPGDVIWTGNDTYEYLVKSVQENSFVIGSVRKKGSTEAFVEIINNKIVSYVHLVGPVNCHTFKTEKNRSDNPSYGIEPVHNESYSRRSQFDPEKYSNAFYEEVIAKQLTPTEWFNQIGKNLTFASSQRISIPRTALAEPIMVVDYCDRMQKKASLYSYQADIVEQLSQLAKQYNVNLITGEQKMKVTDFDKDNLKAGKEDAIANKKAWEREQANQAYTALLNQLDSVNSRIKMLESEKKTIEAEMAKFG